jgi:hypothetical protein
MIKTFAEGNQTLAPGDVAHFLWGGCDWASTLRRLLPSMCALCLSGLALAAIMCQWL